MSIIDFNTFEGLRKQGISDDTIAEQMASSNKSFADQYGRLKAKSQGDPRATTAYLNYRFYGDANHAAKEPERQKGYIGRTLDKMMDRSMEVRQSLDDYNAGEQGGFNTTAQISANLFRGVLSPATEGVSTVINEGLELTGLDEPLANAVQGVIGSDFAQGIINSKQAQGVSNFMKNNPTGRTIADVGMAGFDALEFLGAGAAAKTGGRLGMAGAQTGVRLGMAGAQKGLSAAKATGRAVRHPIDTIRGFRGTSAPKGVDALGEPIKELTDLGRNAVKQGIDEKVIRFAYGQSPETKLLAQEMTREAYKGSKLLEGTTKHTEIVGQQVLVPLEYSLKIKGEIGSRLGVMKKARYGNKIDITEEFGALRSSLDELGVQIGNKGRIVSTGALPNDAKPLIQQLVDFFGDADGPVIKYFKDIDQFRSKMFDELGSAKGKVNIEQARIFDKTEQLVNDMREAIFLRAANGDQALILLNKMYGQINKPISTFMQRSGIGKLNSQLNVDDLNVADLKAGQFSNRILGNAAADSKAELQAILEVAKKLGFRSNVNIESLVTYRRALEDLYKVQRPSSLAGQMGSAVGNGMVGDIIQDATRGVGATRIVVNAVGEGVMRIFNKMTGLNPEQQTKLLLELFNTSDDARLLQVVEKALGENIAGRVDDLIPNSTTVGDAKKVLQSSMDDVPASSLDDAAQLTPEQLPGANTPKGPLTNKSPEVVDMRQYIYELKQEIARKKSVINDSPDMRGLMNRKTRELPEVTGVGKSRFSREGDVIADQLGMEDSEAFRRAHERTMRTRDEVKSLQSSLKDAKDEVKRMLAPEPQGANPLEATKAFTDFYNQANQ